MKSVRTVDISENGADGLFDFISQFHDQEGKQQAYLEIQLDDGTVLDKAEIVAEDYDGEVIYYLRLSGL